MADVWTGPLIGAGAQLASGLLGTAAQKAEAERQRKAQMEQEGLQKQAQAAGALSSGQQSAFKEMMEGYRTALLGGR